MSAGQFTCDDDGVVLDHAFNGNTAVSSDEFDIQMNNCIRQYKTYYNTISPKIHDEQRKKVSKFAEISEQTCTGWEKYGKTLAGVRAGYIFTGRKKSNYQKLHDFHTKSCSMKKCPGGILHRFINFSAASDVFPFWRGCFPIFQKNFKKF